MFLSLVTTLFRTALLAMAVFPFASVADADDDNALDTEMRRCTTVASDDTRLACFDELATAILQENEIPADDQAAAVNPLTDEVGRNSVRRDDPVEQPGYAATLTRCDRSSTGRYFFYFSNGQIWKQTSSGRLRFRDCNLDVTISKDVFGFKMSIAGERGRIRISRVK